MYTGVMMRPKVYRPIEVHEHAEKLAKTIGEDLYLLPEQFAQMLGIDLYDVMSAIRGGRLWPVRQDEDGRYLIHPDCVYEDEDSGLFVEVVQVSKAKPKPPQAVQKRMERDVNVVVYAEHADDGSEMYFDHNGEPQLVRRPNWNNRRRIYWAPKKLQAPRT